MLAEMRTAQGVTGLNASKDGRGALAQLTGGTYQEAVLAGNVFGGCSQSGVTSQAGLSGTTPTLTLYNPAGSGVDCVLWYAGAAYTVAFATAGAIWLGLHQTAPAAKAVSALGTVLTTARNLKIGTGLANQGRCQLLLACTAATPVAIALLGAGLTGAITVQMTNGLGRWFDGSIVLQEDTAVSIQTGVASGASGQFCEFIWEEKAK